MPARRTSKRSSVCSTIRPQMRAGASWERSAPWMRTLASHRAALFELERMQGNHARSMEYGEALLASGEASEDFIAKYAAFLLYERGDIDRAAVLAARSASQERFGDSTFAMVLFRIWADGYLSEVQDPDNRGKLETCTGANRDLV